MTEIIISGANGKMGNITQNIIKENDSFNIIALYDPSYKEQKPLYSDKESLPNSELVIDFCTSDAIFDNCIYWQSMYKNIIVGSSGLTKENIAHLSSIILEDQLIWIVPNFSIGSVLQKRWATEASKYYDNVHIEERHHSAKQDAPSGTSYDLASSLENLSSDKPTYNLNGKKTIVNNIEINSLRNDQYLAEQEVIFSDPNEMLRIEHISKNRESYETGIILALDHYQGFKGICIGLDVVLGK